MKRWTDDRIKGIYDMKQGKEGGQAESRGSKKKKKKAYWENICVVLKWSEVVVRELEDNVSRVDNYAG